MYRDRQHISAVWVLILSFMAAIATVTWIGATPAGASQAPTGVDLAGKPVDPLACRSRKAGGADLHTNRLPDLQPLCPDDSANQLRNTPARRRSGWSIPTRRSPDTAIRQHLHDYGYKLPALHDPQHSLVKLGQAQVTPEVAVFDASGQIVYHGRIDNWYESFGHARSAPTTHELNEAIKAVLKGNKPQVATDRRSGLLHLGPRMTRSYQLFGGLALAVAVAASGLVATAGRPPARDLRRHHATGLHRRQQRARDHLQSRYCADHVSLLRFLSSVGRGGAVSASDL